MKILLLAGEESGLIYANRLRELLADCEIRSYADYGFQTSDLAVMGFAAVLRRIGFFLEVKKTMEKAIDEWRPDVVCTIDYPGMNLKLSAYAKSRGIRTLHIVCPQVWAWRAGRIPKIEASTDALCCFLPFEPALFRPGFATYVGHPLAEYFKGCANGAERGRAAGGRNVLAILPGSRIGEINHNLPTLLDAAELLGPGVEVAVPAANPGAEAAIDGIISARGAGRGGLKVTRHPVGSARKLLLSATCAAVASGTATLEAALARCPTVLVYRVSAALAWFARRAIKGVGHIGLANIVWEKSGGGGEAPMPELLQEDFTAENVADALRKWLDDPAARRAAAERLDRTVARLETDGSAFAKMAAMIKGENT